jgi:hypothetical protein
MKKGGRGRPGAISNWPDEVTNEPLVADLCNFYKIEKWTKDGGKVDSMLYARNNLDKARGNQRRPGLSTGNGAIGAPAT